MKNIIFIHMESMSEYVYRMNYDLFPNLKKWESESVTFSNYFSTATSTFMTLSDLFYEDMSVFEYCDSIKNITPYNEKASFLDKLKKLGYTVKAFDYPKNGIDLEASNKRNFIGRNVVMEEFNQYDGFIEAIENICSLNQPIALVLCSYLSNISFNYNIVNGRYRIGLDRWSAGYRALDNMIGEIMAIIEKKQLLENSIIVFYGDHGDDIYSHGFHGGLTHAIEPYAQLIHCPLWIYDKDLKPEKITKLYNATDIAGLVEGLMQEEKSNLNKFFSCKREYTIARNEYSLQPVRHESFNKGYSITDGRFLLLVTSRGLEFYQIEIDPCCGWNLLNLFILENDYLLLDNDINKNLKYHYMNIINLSSIRVIRQKFYYYRKRLKEEIQKLTYKYCQAQVLNEMNFERINYR